MTRTITVGAVFISLACILHCTGRISRDFDFSSQNPYRAKLKCPERVTDYDCNIYTTVVIGTQCWISENLKVTHYCDGKDITDSASIEVDTYGRLYTWASVSDPSGLCPRGWHVPSDREFQAIEIAVGMAPETAQKEGWRRTSNESRRLKKYDYAYSWSAEEKEEVNKYGYSLLPGGGAMGVLKGAAGLYSEIWTSTGFNEGKAWYRSLVWPASDPGHHKIRRNPVSKKWAFSVRCLKD